MEDHVTTPPDVPTRTPQIGQNPEATKKSHGGVSNCYVAKKVVGEDLGLCIF